MTPFCAEYPLVERFEWRSFDGRSVIPIQAGVPAKHRWLSFYSLLRSASLVPMIQYR